MRAAFTSARLTALSKPDGGIRGIATGCTLWRLVARALAKQFMKAFEKECAPFQYALSTRGGTDCVGHILRAATGQPPDPGQPPPRTAPTQGQPSPRTAPRPRTPPPSRGWGGVLGWAGLGWAGLCCAVLCCVVLCCVVLCCVVLCCAVLLCRARPTLANSNFDQPLELLWPISTLASSTLAQDFFFHCNCFCCHEVGPRSLEQWDPNGAP